MIIKVNGKTIDFDKANLKDLVLDYKLEKKQVVVEKNGVIINCDNYQDEMIKEGDNIEIIRMVGGG